MKKLIINGGVPLCGSVRVAGSKNGALPILFAALSVSGISQIVGMPQITDAEVTLDILSSFGVKSEKKGDSLFLDTRKLHYRIPSCELVNKIRASSYLLGACLARFGEYRLQDFGGCSFSDRPIDLHIYGAKALGATFKDGILSAERLCGAEIELKKPSVGATVNSLIMAASAEGESVIKGYAKEPHVMLLIDFLRSCGAKITEDGEKITVKGGKLHGGRVEVIGDMIEAGTYLTAGLISGGEICVSGICAQSMEPYISLIRRMGGKIETNEHGICAKADGRLSFASVTAAPYPAFPTDLQPIVAPLFACSQGGEITDSVFPERFGYLDVLSSFGIKYERRKEGALILPSVLHASEVTAPCLRGAAACLLTALAVSGESAVHSAELLFRGYESPVEKLSSLGALIRQE